MPHLTRRMLSPKLRADGTHPVYSYLVYSYLAYPTVDQRAFTYSREDVRHAVEWYGRGTDKDAVRALEARFTGLSTYVQPCPT